MNMVPNCHRSIVARSALLAQRNVAADKFQVLRLLSPHINRGRRLVVGERRSVALRTRAAAHPINLDPARRFALDRWLGDHPELSSSMPQGGAARRLSHGGADRGSRVFTALTDSLATASVPELRTFRRTLPALRTEILAYCGPGLSYGRSEGFSKRAKL